MTTRQSWMQAHSRQLIYLALTITLVVALIVGKPVSPIVLPSVQQLYDEIEKAPANPGDHRIILVATTFSASTKGESMNQARAIMRHLMLAHKRFAIISVGEPQGAKLGPAIAADLAKQYGYVYGTDWINFGYQLNTLAFFKAFPQDIPGTIKTDGTLKKPIAGYPIMHGIKTIDDNIALHIEITASASVFDWLQIVQPATNPRLKIGYACTGVMAAEAYPYLDAGQLVGMLPGLKGASDYEKLVDDREAAMVAAGQLKAAYDPAKSAASLLPKPARQLMFTQGIAHMVILLLILLGNLGLLFGARAVRTTPKETN